MDYSSRDVKVLQRYHQWILMTNRGPSLGRIKTVALRNAIMQSLLKQQEEQLKLIIEAQKSNSDEKSN